MEGLAVIMGQQKQSDLFQRILTIKKLFQEVFALVQRSLKKGASIKKSVFLESISTIAI